MTEILNVNGDGELPARGIDRLLLAATKYKASDLHVKVGQPPIFRVKGSITRAKGEPLTAEQVEKMFFEMMGPKERAELERLGGADFAYNLGDIARFRVNIVKQRGVLSMSARSVKTTIPTLEELHLPPALRNLANLESGLVLAAGITGSGKSTTLATLIEIINQTLALHIVTIENPIEYMYRDEKSFVTQREVGIDVPDFPNGMRTVLRQDPDVILVGEMRDPETIDAALMACETGHLVFGTIHCSTAAQSIGRILEFFPQERHHQIRQLLYFNLRAVLVQKLLKGCTRAVPRIPAVEIMFVNALVKKMIMDGEDKKIPDIIRGSRHEGMQDFNQALCELVKGGLVAEAVAMEASPNPEQLAMNLKGINLSMDRGSISG